MPSDGTSAINYKHSSKLILAAYEKAGWICAQRKVNI